jgi:predicted nucleotidyltransferase
MEFYGNYQVYSESGVDLTLLRENLRRSVEERIQKNQRGIRLVAGLQQAERITGPNKTKPRRPIMVLDAETLIQHLVNHQIEFVLIGGLAMRVQGSAHITEDLDLCYQRTAENIAAIAAAFEPLHPYLRGVPPGLPFKFDVATIQAGLNFTLVTDLGDVDLLGEVSGIGFYEQALAQSESWQVFGVTVQVLSLEALIKSKKAAARKKDQNHILELEELKKMRDAQSDGG